MNNATEQFVQFCPFPGSITFFVVVHFPSNKYINSQIIYCIANCVLVVPTVLLNGISILTISRSPQLKGKLCYFLILIQSTIDFLVGMVSLPLYASIRAKELLGTANCISILVYEELAYMLIGLSFSTLTVLTFERYMGVLHPVAHRSYLTKRRIVIFILFCVVPTFIVGKESCFMS